MVQFFATDPLTDAACSKLVCAGTNIPNSTTNVSDALSNFVHGAMLLLGGLAVIFMIVGGLQYVLSGGNPSRTKTARETMIYAAVGLVIATSAYAIVTFITGRL